MREKSIAVLLVAFAVSMVAFGKDDLHRERERAASRSSCLLSLTDNYSLHLLRGGVHETTDGYVIAHISHKTGEIRWLYSSGISEEPTRRVTYTYKRFCGILLHQGSLYALVFESPRFTTGDLDLRPDPRELQTHLQRVAVDGCFKMLVFDVASGAYVGEHRYAGPVDQPPYAEYLYSNPHKKVVYAYDGLGHGPMLVKEQGIECFGFYLAVNEGKLVARSLKETTKNTEPPAGRSIGITSPY